MIRRKHGQSGVALVMVLLLIAAATVLAYGYVTSTTVKSVSSNNLVKAAEAQYLAESGLQHALYVLKSNPDLLEGSPQKPLGPFQVDGADETYTFYAVEDEGTPGLYYITAESNVGGVGRHCSLTVQFQVGARMDITHGVMIGGAGAIVPASVSITGDVHNNGAFLWNLGHIDGDVSSYGNVWDPFNWITGDVAWSPQIDLPTINPDQYKIYDINGATGTAIEKYCRQLTWNDDLNGGGSISPDNIGGVLWLQPNGSHTDVRIRDGVHYEGTIIIEGDLLLDGQDITITAQDGFPAIVATGRILVSPLAEATINGLVVTGGGIEADKHAALLSSTTINGGLIAESQGYVSGLLGKHELNYDPDLCSIYDFSGASGTVVGGGSGSGMAILEYD